MPLDAVSDPRCRELPLPLKLWCLTAREIGKPPFHTAMAAHTVFVVAPNEEGARALAFMEVQSKAWGDPALTMCFEFRPKMPGVVVAVAG